MNNAQEVDTLPPPPATRKDARLIWDEGRKVDATLAEKIRPYLYELCLLDLPRHIRSLAVGFWDVLASSFRLLRFVLKSSRDLCCSPQIHRFVRSHKVAIALALVYVCLFVYIELNYGHGKIIFILTSLTLIYLYGFEDDASTTERRRRGNAFSAYSVSVSDFHFIFIVVHSQF